MDSAFLLGLIGTVLSIASLTWQVVTWRESEPDWRLGITGAYPSARAGPPSNCGGVTVTNRGGATTIVSGVTSRLPDGGHMPLIQDALGQIRFPREI